MRRRLRWLGHVERMNDTHIPKYVLVYHPASGKRLPGGKKRRWNDVMMSDMKSYDLLPNWRNMAQDRAAWRGWKELSTAELNSALKESEAGVKSERKQRREGATQPTQSSLRCTEPGCLFIGQTKAGLINHSRQKHSSEAQSQLQCPYCGHSFQRQGIVIHIRFCKSNPDQPKQKRTRIK